MAAQFAATNPWDIPEGAYPAASLPADQLRFLLSYAVLAPSGHNTQPWRFRIADDSMELYADRAKALAVADPHDRELTISCGAALFHLRLALRHFQFMGEIKLFPDPDDLDLLARVRHGTPTEGTEGEEALFRVIPLRRTNRRPFDTQPVPDGLAAALADAAPDEGAWLHIVEDTAIRASVGGLVDEGNRIQWADKQFRRELADWVHPSRCGDGLPGLYMHGVGPLVIRTFNLGKSIVRTDRKLAKAAPLLAVLGTDDDTPRTWLMAGQALARLLLRARADGVDAAYFNQPVQVKELRPQLAGAIGVTGYPQVVVRMGYGPPSPPAPRRPAEAVLLPRSGQ